VIRPVAATETAAVVVLTCCDCGRTYAPSAADLEAGRTACPYPACDGWTFHAQLAEPRIADARTSNEE